MTAHHYRTISDSFWSDPDISVLKPEHKLIYLYFLTCPTSHTSGIYYLPLETVSVETGLPMESIDTLIDKVSIRYSRLFRIVFIPKMMAHQPVWNDAHTALNAKFKIGLEHHLLRLHKCPLVNEFLNVYNTLDILYPTPIPIDTPIDGLSTAYRRPIDATETETETEIDPISVRALEGDPKGSEEREAPSSHPSAHPKKLKKGKSSFPVEDQTFKACCIEWAKLNPNEIDPLTEFEVCRDHWRSTGESRADWMATWRNWYRRAKEFRKNSRNTLEDPPEDFSWVEKKLKEMDREKKETSLLLTP